MRFVLVCLNRFKYNLMIDCYLFENKRLISFLFFRKSIYRPHFGITDCACDVMCIEILLGKFHRLDYYG